MSWGEGWDVWIELPKHRAPRESHSFLSLGPVVIR